MRGRRVARLAAIAAALLVASPASAHLGHPVARAERYLKLDVAGHSARLVVSVTLGEREGGRVLAAADADASGDVSQTERDAYLARWGEKLRSELAVRVDGRSVELAWGEPFMEPIGRVRPVVVTIEMVASFELGGGRETIRIEDRTVGRDVYDRTDVAFRARDAAELVASGIGEGEPTDATPDLAYADVARGEPVVLTAVVETPARSTRLLWIVAAAVGTLSLVAGAAMVVRHRAPR